MKSWASWSLWVTVGAIGAAAGVAAFNLAIDPYSVFKTNEGMRTGYNPNERYRKIEFLRRNPGKHDSFVIGASTMGLMPTEALHEMRPSGRWYNLSFLAGTPPEALRALKYLKSQGEPIKEVVFGIDMFAFRKIEASRELWRREHPSVTGESQYSWWKRNVFGSTLMDGTERLTHNWFNDKPRLIFDFDNTGRYYLARWDREIERDPKEFVRKQIYEKHQNANKQVRQAGIALVQERFDELGELKAWLDENGVESHFWINPIHWKSLATIEPATLEEFRSKVRKAIGSVPDYTLRKDICENDEGWYEWQHYRPQVAGRILREVMGVNEAVPKPKGGGSSGGVEVPRVEPGARLEVAPAMKLSAVIEPAGESPRAAETTGARVGLAEVVRK